jgi:hypothetical protein
MPKHTSQLCNDSEVVEKRTMMFHESKLILNAWEHQKVCHISEQARGSLTKIPFIFLLVSRPTLLRFSTLHPLLDPTQGLLTLALPIARLLPKSD